MNAGYGFDVAFNAMRNGKKQERRALKHKHCYNLKETQMGEIHGFPKIFHIGDRYIPDLFKGTVEVTEKVDGSQFGFGISADGALVCRSKGKELFVGAPEKMFALGVSYVTANEAKIREVLKPNSFIYGEFLGSPSHNILKYGRVPKNNIIVFGALIENAWVSDYEALKTLASSLDLETVPLVFKGEVSNYEELTKLFEADSILGAEKIEGVVIKNYDSPCFLGSIVQPSFAKYVRAEFKERHASDWGPKFNGRDKMAMLIESV